jgi:hypothetical protein
MLISAIAALARCAMQPPQSWPCTTSCSDLDPYHTPGPAVGVIAAESTIRRCTPPLQIAVLILTQKDVDMIGNAATLRHVLIRSSAPVSGLDRCGLVLLRGATVRRLPFPRSRPISM